MEKPTHGQAGEYRKNLSKELKNLRSVDRYDNNLAEQHLEKARETDEYIQAENVVRDQFKKENQGEKKERGIIHQNTAETLKEIISIYKGEWGDISEDGKNFITYGQLKIPINQEENIVKFEKDKIYLENGEIIEARTYLANLYTTGRLMTVTKNSITFEVVPNYGKKQSSYVKRLADLGFSLNQEYIKGHTSGDLRNYEEFSGRLISLNNSIGIKYDIEEIEDFENKTDQEIAQEIYKNILDKNIILGNGDIRGSKSLSDDVNVASESYFARRLCTYFDNRIDFKDENNFRLKRSDSAERRAELKRFTSTTWLNDPK